MKCVYISAHKVHFCLVLFLTLYCFHSSNNIHRHQILWLDQKMNTERLFHFHFLHLMSPCDEKKTKEVVGWGWGKEFYLTAVSEIYYIPWHKIKTHCNESLYFMLLILRHKRAGLKSIWNLIKSQLHLQWTCFGFNMLFGKICDKMLEKIYLNLKVRS